MIFKNGVTNVDYVWMSLKATSNFNIPQIAPNCNAYTWSSRWGQLKLMKILDCQGILWPGTASSPIHKSHSISTDMLKISELWHGPKISPILADLCHIDCAIIWQMVTSFDSFFLLQISSENFSDPYKEKKVIIFLMPLKHINKKLYFA